MAWQRQAVCDVCGIVKRETNHWLLLYQTESRFTVRPWSKALEDEDLLLFLCGDRCASTALNRWLDAIKSYPTT